MDLAPLKPERVAVGFICPRGRIPLLVVCAIHFVGDNADILYLDSAVMVNGNVYKIQKRVIRAVEVVSNHEAVCAAPVLIITENAPGAVASMIHHMISHAPSLQNKPIEFAREYGSNKEMGVPATRQLLLKYCHCLRTYSTLGRLRVDPRAFCGKGLTLVGLEQLLRDQIARIPTDDTDVALEVGGLARVVGMTIYWVERLFDRQA